MRGRAETVRNAAVWADTTRPYSVGQEGVQAMVDISFRVALEPGTSPFVDTSALIRANVLVQGALQPPSCAQRLDLHEAKNFRPFRSRCVSNGWYG